MPASHHRVSTVAAIGPGPVPSMGGRRPVLGRNRETGEAGYVLVMFALLLVPLLLVVGLSVDVGSWYNRASNIQKAADAAALSGVVWLPDLDKARTNARETAARNGFVHGQNGITVDVEQVETRRIRVSINDPEVGSFFYSSLGGDDIALRRDAMAEYVLAVPLGSPRNYFGTGTLASGAARENLWLSVNTYCTDKVDGDQFQSRFVGNRPYSTSSCPTNPSSRPAIVNHDYRERGYEFYVDVPENRTGNIEVLLYDARYQPTTTANQTVAQPDVYLRNGAHSFTYAMFQADSTPLNDSDNPPMPSCTRTFSASTSFDNISFLGQSRWNRLCTITTSMPTGRYILRVTNTHGGTASQAAGANQFGIVAKYTSAAYTQASALCDARTVSTCPRVYGKDAMSVFASENSSTADFYLAEVEPLHAGKTLYVDLYDPGEGGSDLRIRRPTGSNTWTDATFRWSDDVGRSGGPTTTLDVTGDRFDGRLLRLEISLAGYTPPANNNWWQIRYNFNNPARPNVTDRTTWSARIVGDPVHLVEDDA